MSSAVQTAAFLSFVVAYAYGALQCISSSQCPSGSLCVPSADGYKVCSAMPTMLNKDSTLISMNYKYCKEDSDCQGIGSRCITYGWYGVCELTVEEGSISKYRKKGENETCTRDEDCLPELQCVRFNGTEQCQISFKIPPSFECQSHSQCAKGMYCLYSSFYKKSICQRKASADEGIWVDNNIDSKIGPDNSENNRISRFDTRSINYPNAYAGIGSGALPSGEIGTGASASPGIGGGAIPFQTTTPAFGSGVNPYATTTAVAFGGGAIPHINSPIPCTSDFQCPTGDSCSAWAYINGVNTRVCTEGQLATGQVCLYNSQCPIGELCERNASGIYVCKYSYAVSMERSCSYDFECSGGWKCMNIRNDYQKEFRCRPPRSTSYSPASRRSTLCRSNADCGPNQFCVYYGSQWQCAVSPSRR